MSTTLCPNQTPAVPRNQILRFIEEWVDQHGFSPTVSEITQAFGVDLHQATISQLKALHRKGYITIGAKKARVIRLNTILPSRPNRKAWKRLCEGVRRHQQARQDNMNPDDIDLYILLEDLTKA